MTEGLVESLSRFGFLLSGLLLGCLLLIRVGSLSVEVQRVWEVYDDRLQFMTGLWVDFEESWAFASCLQPAPTC